MTDMAPDQNIPPLTLGWRLKMTLRTMSTQAMADSLEVSRATVSRWMADKGAPPRTVFIKQWALITRTDVKWLLYGGEAKSPQPGVPDEGSEPVRREGIEPPTRWYGDRRRRLRVVREIPHVLPNAA